MYWFYYGAYYIYFCSLWTTSHHQTKTCVFSLLHARSWRNVFNCLLNVFRFPWLRYLKISQVSFVRTYSPILFLNIVSSNSVDITCEGNTINLFADHCSFGFSSRQINSDRISLQLSLYGLPVTLFLMLFSPNVLFWKMCWSWRAF